jgi:hypothetical protein
MDKEKLLSQAADARLVHMNEHLIFPLLNKRIDMAVTELCTQLKTDGQVKLSTVAYMAACRDLATELEAIARTGDRAFNQLNKEGL